MRAIGYSFEAALADLIYNSSAAQARAINTRFSVAGEPYVAIIDDGNGRAPNDLTSAMFLLQSCWFGRLPGSSSKTASS